MKNAFKILLLLLVASQGATLSAQEEEMEQEFNEAVDYFEKTYRDARIPQAHNITYFRFVKDWPSNTMWFASNSGKGPGYLIMPGALARRLEGRLDTYTLAICEEMGRLFAGYPAYNGSNSMWPRATMGNRIYYSTFACTTLLWQNQLEQNATYRSIVTPKAKTFCDDLYPDSVKDQNLCYREITAAIHLSTFMNRDRPVSIDKPSEKIVEKTVTGHTFGQCYFDTYLAGIACKAHDRWDHYSLPRNEADMARTSCASTSYPTDPAETIRQGLRPRCWYAPPAAH